MKKSGFTATLLVLSYLPLQSFAETSWVDNSYANVRSTLHSWSNSIDSWFGTPDPDKPASASLRIMLDNEWNHYDGYSIKPRIRGKIKLPTLKQHLNLVFGDEVMRIWIISPAIKISYTETIKRRYPKIKNTTANRVVTIMLRLRYGGRIRQKNSALKRIWIWESVQERIFLFVPK